MRSSHRETAAPPTRRCGRRPPSVPCAVPSTARPTWWAALVNRQTSAGHRGQHPGPAGPYATDHQISRSVLHERLRHQGMKP